MLFRELEEETALWMKLTGDARQWQCDVRSLLRPLVPRDRLVSVDTLTERLK